MRASLGRRIAMGALAALGIISILAQPATAQERVAPDAVTSEDVQAAVRSGVVFLRSRQRANGTWKDSSNYKGGTTALCLLALLNSGVPATDPSIVDGLKALDEIENAHTYVVSLKLQVYAAIDPAAYHEPIAAGAEWLIQAQHRNGMWSYTMPSVKEIKDGGDNSNTQFALLGLHEACKADIPIPHATWQLSQEHYVRSQNRDGGWDYTTGKSKSYGSMTAAALASLHICGQTLHVGGHRQFINGMYPDCGAYTQNKPIALGLAWLARRFTVQTNPGKGSWQHYYLYALERTGMIAGLRLFGRHDWFREGAAYLVSTQNPNGSWMGKLEETAFSLLFLAKGNRPVLIQKVKWNGHWNRNIHDLQNLCGFIGTKFGKPVTWQTASLDLPMEELRVSPVLHITGHTFPAFSDDEKLVLKKYVDDAGGTLLFEACCGKEEFTAGFRGLAEELWPETPCRPLDASHPVINSYFELQDLRGLEGIDAGCRTGVFFSPQALSALWELQDIPDLSEQAFQIGTNICAYATGREQLKDRLATIDLPEKTERNPNAERQIEAERGTIRIARLVHQGDFNSDPHADQELAALLREQAGLDVVAQARHIRGDDPGIYEYPVVFMTGHYNFYEQMTESEKQGLKDWLEKGGFLMAEPCCGKAQFDADFRRLMKDLFPETPLAELPDDHPIYTGQTGIELGELKFRTVLAKDLGRRGTTKPPLEAITLDGRTAVLYSKYDYSCGLEGDNPYSCRGYQNQDSQRLAMSIFLYAISY